MRISERTGEIAFQVPQRNREFVRYFKLLFDVPFRFPIFSSVAEAEHGELRPQSAVFFFFVAMEDLPRPSFNLINPSRLSSLFGRTALCVQHRDDLATRFQIATIFGLKSDIVQSD